MLIKPDCIPCILRMSITAIRELALNEYAVKELYSRILEIPSLRGQFWDITSAEIIELVWGQIADTTKRRDPFYSLKLEQNKRIMEIYPFLEKVVDEAPDPLSTAVKLAILGNAIDVMISDSKQGIEDSITEKLKMPISKEMFGEFSKRLKQSRHLLFFGDNSGEIVFDKLLIETIRKMYDPEIAFVVRSVPTLNDATLDEARQVGIDKAATLIENGIDGPLPGTILRRCSTEVTDLVSRADLIISKGGGNFDTLEEEKGSLKEKITFMLLSKCDPYYKYFGVKIQHPVLANFFEERIAG
jgi:damage-control phosphatase, subfamily I